MTGLHRPNFGAAGRGSLHTRKSRLAPHRRLSDKETQHRFRSSYWSVHRGSSKECKREHLTLTLCHCRRGSQWSILGINWVVKDGHGCWPDSWFHVPARSTTTSSSIKFQSICSTSRPTSATSWLKPSHLPPFKFMSLSINVSIVCEEASCRHSLILSYTSSTNFCPDGRGLNTRPRIHGVGSL